MSKLRTKILEATEENILAAADVLADGGLVAFPTETVYGIGANALDKAAVADIFTAKGRPQDNPLIVHITEIEELLPLVTDFPEVAQKLARALWPGPLTMILPRSDRVDPAVSAGLSTVAIRMPSHPVARKLIAAAGVPVAAPSANRSGRPSPTSAQHCIFDLSGRVDVILDGGSCEVGLESTVITFVDGIPRVLRPGGITPEQIKAVCGAVEIDDGALRHIADDTPVASPGMKYRHYAPRARVTLLRGGLPAFAGYIEHRYEEDAWAMVFDEDLAEAKQWRTPAIAYGGAEDAAAQAGRLFSLLRELDDKGAKRIYVRSPRPEGVGLAVYNRLLRAASFDERDLEQEAPYGAYAFGSGPLTGTGKPHAPLIGLTGQTGAGKSQVSAMLRELGFDVIDADLVSREVVEPDTDCLREIAEAFGPEILTPEGALDRRKMGDIVFANAAERERLGSIIFPHIMQTVHVRTEALRENSRGIFLDAPTLFESGADKDCDHIVSVTAPLALRRERILRRDGLTEEQAARRISSQHEDDFYASRSDYVIVNDGSIADLRKTVGEMLSHLGLHPER